MSTNTSTRGALDVRLDEHLEAEIEHSARCDMILGYFVRTPAGLIPTGEPHQRCPRPADWILRTLCQCGHHGLELLCTPHLYDANIERQCSSCGAYSSFVARTPEHL